MSGSHQDVLREAWLGGRPGELSALAEARAWALRECWRDQHESEYGMLRYIAERVEKTGGGNPSREAVRVLLGRIDADPQWYPGKVAAAKRNGPEPVLRAAKRRAVATSAERLKKSGQEPTYSRVVAQCPEATRNPQTGAPVHKKQLYAVLKQDCFDEGADEPWEHKARYSKAALTPDMMRKRLAFARHVRNWRRTVRWFRNNVVWTDICNSILPRTEAKASAQALARKGKRGWVSKGSEMHSANLRGKKEDLKQNSWGTIKVWWAPVLMRGKLHVVVFDSDYPGETPEGAEALVAGVRGAVNKRFQGGATKPDTLMVDRGRGFYNNATGGVTKKYGQALRDHGFKNLMGDNASVQPGHMQEILLHETAVSWIRLRLEKTVPRKPWLETTEQYASRLRGVVDDINANLDVEGLRKGLPKRLDLVIEAKGGRIPK